MKKLALLCLIGLIFGLAGCLPVSQNPLCAPEDATTDARLAGVWYGKSGADEIFLHFVPGTGAEMQAVEVDHEKKGAAHTTLYSLLPVELGGHRYLNIREGKDKPYYLARYQITEGGTLRIWLMSENAAAKAIKNGKIKGKIVQKSGDNRDITLTDTTEHLAAFVRKADPELLFDQKFGTFKKVTLPSVGESEKPKSTPKKSTGKKRKK